MPSRRAPSAKQQVPGPRIAVLGFHLESNAFAAPSDERQFRSLCYVEGGDISREARKEVSALPAEIPAFYREMETLGSWIPAPIIVTAAEPGGPVDERFFQSTLAAMRARLAVAGRPAHADRRDRRPARQYFGADGGERRRPRFVSHQSAHGSGRARGGRGTVSQKISGRQTLRPGVRAAVSHAGF